LLAEKRRHYIFSTTRKSTRPGQKERKKKRLMSKIYIWGKSLRKKYDLQGAWDAIFKGQRRFLNVSLGGREVLFQKEKGSYFVGGRLPSLARRKKKKETLIFS